MPLAATDLIQPKGRVPPDLFGDDTADWVEAWLDEAEAETADLSSEVAEKAQRLWVYYRAWDAKANQLAQQPMDATVAGDTSRRYVREQITTLRVLADEALVEFRSYVPEDESGTVEDVMPTFFTTAPGGRGR